ncbi:hypothetical protein CONLIGDRAFT_687810 [Coniochaeta ligniaria NRRL 30616]|uniref:Uncharacterized protein n=1 Tax=Coniochaeta ligniaria NRRL 30616 TaxID=1408157 RepID=A0A1J7ILZ2_9PEZI|nr:hypothetical protein CONLIGDRAFT_687810 [Coniochaeta ligniaria NRRL 30616]
MNSSDDNGGRKRRTALDEQAAALTGPQPKTSKKCKRGKKGKTPALAAPAQAAPEQPSSSATELASEHQINLVKNKGCKRAQQKAKQRSSSAADTGNIDPTVDTAPASPDNSNSVALKGWALRKEGCRERSIAQAGCPELNVSDEHTHHNASAAVAAAANHVLEIDGRFSSPRTQLLSTGVHGFRNSSFAPSEHRNQTYCGPLK